MSAKSYGSQSYGKDKNYESIAVLKDHIKNRKPSRAYLLFGNEPYLIDYYLNELKKMVLADDSQGLNFTVFENKVDISRIIDACETYPIFAERKLVLVKNSSLFFSKNKKNVSVEEDELTAENDDTQEKEASDKGNNYQEALKQYISEVPESACLVFIENQVDKRLGTYKQVDKYGLAVELNRQGEKELAAWVAKGSRQSGRIISQEAADYLVTISEPDMYALKNELMKIISYIGDRKEITVEDVKLLAIPTIKSVIFDLLDAAAEKDSPRALRLLDDMLSIKEPEQKILAMLSKQTGELLKVKYLIKTGASQAQISSYFQGKHPYALKILINQAERMDEKYLKGLLKNCMEAETSYKRGKIDPRLSLEVLLAKMNS